jgi:hypothetical protein
MPASTSRICPHALLSRNTRAAQADGEESREDEGKTNLKAFAKLTAVVDGERRIVGDPPLIVRSPNAAPSRPM